jgi:dTDP-4-amino-4,6-dideoxygalactose transaminase
MLGTMAHAICYSGIRPKDHAVVQDDPDGRRLSNVPSPAPKSQSVTLLDLSRQYAAIHEEVLAAIERVCASQRFILGPEVEALENEIAAFVGAKDAVGCASGTDALWLALAAAGVGPGDRVITTPFSFFASASSIARCGAEPVFVDVDPETLNLDPAKSIAILRKARGVGQPTITRRGERPRSPRPRGAMLRPQDEGVRGHTNEGRIRAILPVHLYGQCADMDSIQQVADEHNLLVIEDAAQAIGAKWHDRTAGSLGVSAAFSFYPTKNLSAYGEAGIVTTQDASMAEHMRRLRNHGSPERYLHTEFGWNARMDAIQAAVLRVKLKHIDKWNEQRRERAQIYDRVLSEAGLCQSVEADALVRPLRTGASEATGFPIERLYTAPKAFHVFHQYVIRIRKGRRDELRKFLAAQGIGTEVYYPTPLHLQPVFAYLGYKEGGLPESERAAKEVLALPMFPELKEEEQVAVVNAIAEFYN